MGEEAAFCRIVECCMELACAVVALALGAGALRVEMILPRCAGNEFPVLGHADSFAVGLVVFHE